MSENKKEINPQEIIKQANADTQKRVADALALLKEEPVTIEQLSLFEDFNEYNEKQKETKQTKLSTQQLVAAQLLALGFNYTQTYILTHPEADTSNKNSLWSRASKFCKSAKVQARVLEVQSTAAGKALMSVTRAQEILSDLAENAVKEEVRRQSVVNVLELHGKFDKKKEFEIPENAVLNVRFVNGKAPQAQGGEQ